MKKYRLVAMVAVLLAAGLGGWFGLGRRTEPAVAAPTGGPLVPVSAASAKAENVPIFAEGLGTVQTINSVNVKSRIDGQIEKVFFTDGQEVTQGDLLFLIDPRPYQAALDQAQANRERDEAQLQGAELNLDRYSKLVGSGFQTRQSYDDQKATVAQLKATLKADQAAIETAQINLQYATIRAPITGRTGKLMVDAGNYIQTGTGTTLVSLTQIKPIYVDFSLAQTLLDQIRQAQAKQPLTVKTYSGETKEFLAQGKLRFIDNHVDTATGTIALQGIFDNADERLWPGEFVTVRLIIGTRPDAITVPAQTVMAGSNGDYVYVIKPGDTVERRQVTVLSRQDGLAVIGTGLAAGERVVTDGQYRLANNVRVKIQSAARPAG
ncbi:MAG TPA: efflux RND transporter periplasmic adaptor subunit [Acetobacteraceae bacterium]|nr:efflux RND transporter periplasmic adaptor subunit [Acetobacteraceae bacterium]